MEWVTNLGGVSVKRIWSRYFSITKLKCFNGFTILNRKGKIAHWTRPFPRQKNPTAYHTCVWQKGSWSPNSTVLHWQGCIIRSILPSGMGACGVSSEHVKNMEMFSCSPTPFVDVWIKIFKSRTVFFPLDTLIYGISRDGSIKINTHLWAHDPWSAQDESTSLGYLFV